MKEFYTIGEVASMFDVSTDTLRFYDSIDLIKPWKVGENGYRYYSKAQFEMISTVMLLAEIGTPLKRIGEILTCETPLPVQKELDSYVNDIDEQIRKLKARKELAKTLSNAIEASCYDENVRIENVRELYLLVKEYDSLTDEFDLNEIISANEATLDEWTSYASVISTLTKEDVFSGNFHRYTSYGYMSEYPCKTGRKDLLRVIKKQTYATCSVKVESVEHSEIDGCYQKLLDYVKANNLIVCGDIIERNVIDLYGNNKNDLTFFFKVYFPIEY